MLGARAAKGLKGVVRYTLAAGCVGTFHTDRIVTADLVQCIVNDGTSTASLILVVNNLFIAADVLVRIEGFRLTTLVLALRYIHHLLVTTD